MKLAARLSTSYINSIVFGKRKHKPLTSQANILSSSLILRNIHVAFNIKKDRKLTFSNT